MSIQTPSTSSPKATSTYTNQYWFVDLVEKISGNISMSEKYSEHPAMFKNNPLGFILCLILIPVGIGLLILLWWHLQNKSSKLSINDNEILYEQGLLSKHRSEINISSVRTIKIKQSFFNRIFGVGMIEIYTAGDNPEIVAKGMPDPDRVRELIKMQQNGNQ